jgi:hypothetical protein
MPCTHHQAQRLSRALPVIPRAHGSSAARGMCYEGSACTYLHQLPTSSDNAAMERDTGRDIFGRDKLPDNWDNRKGAGSYERCAAMLQASPPTVSVWLRGG